ncbi:MAG: general secretion pathway protein GspK [Phycisphaerae bacterium]|nr:general secretion pathway protein GspK [Phycisphaerae bacterium]
MAGHPVKTTDFNRQGMVLVAVLWTAVLMLVIVGSLVQYSRLDMKVSMFSAQTVACQWASRAGVETVAALLSEDSRTSDALDDLWSDNELDLVEVVLGGAVFNVRVVDEAGKLNINQASAPQLLALPGMTEEIVDAILDWRDQDSDERPAGAETGYYRNLDYPYDCRNAPFKTIRELLLVRGVTPEMLYGEDTNFNGLLDYNERDGDASLPPDNNDDVLEQGWIAYLSCYSKDDDKDGDGGDRVNVNSASLDALQQDLGLSPAHAQWIVDNRGNGFQSIADLISNNSPDEPTQASGNQAQPLDVQTYQQIVDQITVTQGNAQGGGGARGQSGGGARAQGGGRQGQSSNTRAKVNVNTAPKEVLVALLEGRDNPDAEQAALSIVNARLSMLNGMVSIGDLLDVQGLSREQFRKMADWVTVRSNVFTVYSCAMAVETAISGATVVTEAVLDRTESPCQITYWYQGASY